MNKVLINGKHINLDSETRFIDIPSDLTWSFAECKPSETSKWTHGYHRYPAKFIPQVVEKLFDEYIGNKKDVIINDPFMGCGTTIVSAISRGYIAYGTDINHIAYHITKAKSLPFEPKYLQNKIDDFLKKISLLDPKKPSNSLSDSLGLQYQVKPYIPQRHVERMDYWFQESNKKKLGQILKIINEERNEYLRTFFMVAFSNILKNCSIWLQGSTKPTRDKKKTPAEPFTIMKRHLNKMRRGNESFFNIVPSNVRKNIEDYRNIKIGDARKQNTPTVSVDLIVTSSPYVTSYEYADLHQLSAIWFDYTENLKEYRKEFIGTAYKEKSNKVLKSSIANSIVLEMEEKSKKMAREIEIFFIDMHDVIKESYRILKDGGRACYVIGNTALKQVNILNAEVFAELMIETGFQLDRVIKREIPSKILPQTRDAKTGKFAKTKDADASAYPHEFIIIGRK